MSLDHVVIDSCGFRHTVSDDLSDAIACARRIEDRGQLTMRIVCGSVVVLEGPALREVLDLPQAAE